MVEKQKPENEPDVQTSAKQTSLANIFAHTNRGILLDLVVFFFNLFLMTVLSSRLANLIEQAKTDDIFAETTMAFYCLSLCFLLPVGAILKRRLAYRRNPEADIDDNLPGEIRNLILFGQFLSQLIFLIAISGWLLDSIKQFSGQDYSSSSFIYLFFGVPLVAFLNTFFTYFYFLKPKHAPLLNFLQTPQSELLGDACVFLNMILYQAFWGILIKDLTTDFSGIVSRIFMLLLISFIIYLPPRLIYLTADGDRGITWLTILLANSPVIIRIFLT